MRTIHCTLQRGGAVGSRTGIQLAQERLDDSDGSVPKAEVVDEMARVLEDVEAELERQYGEE